MVRWTREWTLLKKFCDSTVGSLKPAMAVTVVVHNVEFWVTPNTGPYCRRNSKALDFIFLSYAPSVHCLHSTCFCGISPDGCKVLDSSQFYQESCLAQNLAGDCTSKAKLCGKGDLLFSARSHSEQEKIFLFPLKRKLPQQTKRRSLVQNLFGTPRAESQPKPWGQRRKGKGGAMFCPPDQACNKQ